MDSRSMAATSHLSERCDDRANDLPRARHAVAHGARFVSAVHHAVAALPVAARDAVLRPVGRFHQLLEGLRIPSFAEQVAGSLPAEDRVVWVTPRSTFVVAVPLQELEIER